jgi:hypothetical protein
MSVKSLRTRQHGGVEWTVNRTAEKTYEVEDGLKVGGPATLIISISLVHDIDDTTVESKKGYQKESTRTVDSSFFTLVSITFIHRDSFLRFHSSFQVLKKENV